MIKIYNELILKMNIGNRFGVGILFILTSLLTSEYISPAQSVIQVFHPKDVTLAGQPDIKVPKQIATDTDSVVDVNPKSVSIKQLSGNPILTIMQSSIYLNSAEGSVVRLDVMSNAKWNVKCSEPWLLSNTESGENFKKVNISAKENTGTDFRKGTVTITVEGLPARIIEVTQKGKHEE